MTGGKSLGKLIRLLGRKPQDAPPGAERLLASAETELTRMKRDVESVLSREGAPAAPKLHG